MKYINNIFRTFFLSGLTCGIEEGLHLSQFILEKIMKVVVLFYLLLFHSCFSLFSISKADNSNYIRQNVGNIRITDIPSISKLPVSAVHRVFQDSEGYIWYGTVNGLCRDDGYQIKVFRSDFHTPGIINDNIIQCISESDDKKIWFGTDHGAYILDKNGYKISKLDENLSSAFIIAIWNSDGFMWVSVTGALYKYDMNGALVKTYEIKNKNGFPSHVNGFCKSRQKEIWITVSNNGIFKYDYDKDSFIPFKYPFALSNVTTIIQDNHYDFFWIGTWGSGVVKFNPWTSESEAYKKYPLPKNSNGQEVNIVLYLTQDRFNDYLWFTTNSDLISMKYDKSTDDLKQVDLKGIMPSGNKMLNDIISDKNGDIWVTAFDRPSIIVNFSDNVPKEYPLKKITERVDYNPAVMSLCDAGEGKIWMSQERIGLCLYDLISDRVTLYKDCISTRDLPLYSIKQMARTESKGCVWVIPENTCLLYKFSHNDMSLSVERKIELPGDFYNCFTKVYEDNDLLWIGTNNGLICYSLVSDSIKYKIPELGNVTSIKSDGKGFIWVSTANKGIYKIQGSEVVDTFKNPKYVSCIDILDKQLWVGTCEGEVIMIDTRTGRMSDFTYLCGLNGDIINQLVVDVYEHIWIATNSRLIEYNPADNSQYSYLTSDASFMLDRFIPTAMCDVESGKLLFGGISGVCAFSPSDRLDKTGGSSTTVITDIMVKEESAFFGDARNRYKVGERLTLSKNDNNVTIFFSSLDFIDSNKIRYAYRLKGLDEEWNYTYFGGNFVTYKHLPKGDYVFEVKATDEYGVWSKNITSLDIKCLPAFYETWWAKSLYWLSASLFIIVLVWYDIRRRNRKNEELYSDSVELSKMREYLVMSGNNKDKSDIKITETEIVQLDELLLQKILKVVEDNMAEPDFDVSVLAEKVGMSRSSLQRKLKSITGLTPLEYIKKVKMKHAKLLLEDHSRTVSEVALTLGYFNRKHFSNCFKEEYGMTPGEYQQSLLETHGHG